MTGTEPHASRGTAGRGAQLGPRASAELHGATGSGTAGRGPHRPRADRGSYASTNAHLGTAGRGTRKGTVGRERAGGAARLRVVDVMQ
jgi:hypothetical protein